MFSIAKKEMKALLRSQQGELDGVEIYKALAHAVKEQNDSETFLRLAADEGRHAAVFYRLSGKRLKPKRWKGKGVALAYRILGKQALYPIIANREYAAKNTYAPMVKLFPEVADIIKDETCHGDAVKNLLSARSERK